MTNRPLGLKIISWWFIIGGTLNILLMFLVGSVYQKEAGITQRDIVVSSFVSALIIVSGIGLLKLKKWGWYTGFAVETILFLYQLIVIPFASKKGLTQVEITAVALGLIIYGAVITYMLRPDIREMCGVSKK